MYILGVTDGHRWLDKFELFFVVMHYNDIRLTLIGSTGGQEGLGETTKTHPESDIRLVCITLPSKLKSFDLKLIPVVILFDPTKQLGAPRARSP